MIRYFSEAHAIAKWTFYVHRLAWLRYQHIATVFSRREISYVLQCGNGGHLLRRLWYGSFCKWKYDMKRTSSARTLLFSLTIVCFALGRNGEMKCVGDPPRDQSRSPENFCDFDVTVFRNLDCSVTVTERYLFPYTSGRDEHRSIPVIEKQQVVEDVVATRDNVTVFSAPLLRSNGGRNEVTVRLPTKKRNEPVLFEVQYTLNPGVVRFVNACDEVPARPPQNETQKVIRWHSRFWRQPFDKMRSSGSTANHNSDPSAKTAGNGQMKHMMRANSKITAWESVQSRVEFLTAEKTSTFCTRPPKCLSLANKSKLPRNWLWIAVGSFMGFACLLSGVIWLLGGRDFDPYGYAHAYDRRRKPTVQLG